MCVKPDSGGSETQAQRRACPAFFGRALAGSHRATAVGKANTDAMISHFLDNCSHSGRQPAGSHRAIAAIDRERD